MSTQTQPDVSVDLFFQDKDESLTCLEIGENGRVRDPLKPGDRLKVVAQVEFDCSHIHVFEIVVQGQWHRPTPLPDRAQEFEMEPGRAYAREFTVGKTGNGLLQLDHRRSSLRVMSLTTAGEFFLDEAGAFVQKGKIFLAHVPSFSGQCYRDENGHVRAPAIGTWETMWVYMEEILGEEAVCNLPPLSDYVPPSPEKQELPEGHARVTWFNPWKGFGYAETAQQSCRIHPNRSRADCQPIFPKPGQIIGYEAIIGGDKPELDGWQFVERN